MVFFPGDFYDCLMTEELGKEAAIPLPEALGSDASASAKALPENSESQKKLNKV